MLFERPLSVGVFAAVILTVAQLWGQSNPTVSGRPTNAVSRQPVSGVLIHFKEDKSSGGSAAVYEGRSDDLGNYRIGDVKPGTYVPVFGTNGFVIAGPPGSLRQVTVPSGTET